jgi:DNA replication and repair protein RecF
MAAPLASAHREIAPEEAAAGGLTLRYVTNAPMVGDETPRDALARRLVDTADKEVWNGSTVIGPHRDDLAFDLAGRDLTGFASRGQQRTAILAFKLAELDLLTELDGRPPLLLLDDVFSELDPLRRAHLVRRIAELPQAFVTTTTLDDLDPGLRAVARAWEVRAADEGAQLTPATAPEPAAGRGRSSGSRGSAG